MRKKLIDLLSVQINGDHILDTEIIDCARPMFTNQVF